MSRTQSVRDSVSCYVEVLAYVEVVSSILFSKK